MKIQTTTNTISPGHQHTGSLGNSSPYHKRHEQLETSGCNALWGRDAASDIQSGLGLTDASRMIWEIPREATALVTCEVTSAPLRHHAAWPGKPEEKTHLSNREAQVMEDEIEKVDEQESVITHHNDKRAYTRLARVTRTSSNQKVSGTRNNLFLTHPRMGMSKGLPGSRWCIAGKSLNRTAKSATWKLDHIRIPAERVNLNVIQVGGRPSESPLQREG